MDSAFHHQHFVPGSVKKALELNLNDLQLLLLVLLVVEQCSKQYLFYRLAAERLCNLSSEPVIAFPSVLMHD